CSYHSDRGHVAVQSGAGWLYFCDVDVDACGAGGVGAWESMWHHWARPSASAGEKKRSASSGAWLCRALPKLMIRSAWLATSANELPSQPWLSSTRWLAAAPVL